MAESAAKNLPDAHTDMPPLNGRRTPGLMVLAPMPAEPPAAG